MNSKRIATVVLSISLLLVVASVLYTNRLTQQLTVEEQKKMQIWAEATRRLILADEGEDIDFEISIIEGNTTIPVYMLDDNGEVILSRNASTRIPNVEDLMGPVELKISDSVTQYIYYEESTLLKQLRYFPYIEYLLILIFIGIGVFTLLVSQRSEQNRVWVGLSKETAHQLGTPISSLNAWLELLRAHYPEDAMIPRMSVDVNRLSTIADRFSKIGSEPDLQPMDIKSVVTDSVSYMRTRVSNKVSISVEGDGAQCEISKALFEWVIENLIKNAVDAMEGAGSIRLMLSTDEDNVFVDVTDTGRGISRHDLNRIFSPGFTTKKRGWGLGLSLSKRIVEDYHRGQLVVRETTLGVGTTFRIILKKSKDR